MKQNLSVGRAGLSDFMITDHGKAVAQQELVWYECLAHAEKQILNDALSHFVCDEKSAVYLCENVSASRLYELLNTAMLQRTTTEHERATSAKFRCPKVMSRCVSVCAVRPYFDNGSVRSAQRQAKAVSPGSIAHQLHATRFDSGIDRGFRALRNLGEHAALVQTLSENGAFAEKRRPLSGEVKHIIGKHMTTLFLVNTYIPNAAPRCFIVLGWSR